MSITFFAPGSPEVLAEEFKCFYCDAETGNPNSDCVECKGTGKVQFYEHELSLNLSNSSAATILKLLDIPFDHCGTWEVNELSGILNRIDGLLMLIVDPSYLRRLTRLKEIISKALANCWYIVWA